MIKVGSMTLEDAGLNENQWEEQSDWLEPFAANQEGTVWILRNGQWFFQIQEGAKAWVIHVRQERGLNVNVVTEISKALK